GVIEHWLSRVVPECDRCTFVALLQREIDFHQTHIGAYGPCHGREPVGTRRNGYGLLWSGDVAAKQLPCPRALIRAQDRKRHHEHKKRYSDEDAGAAQALRRPPWRHRRTATPRLT